MTAEEILTATFANHEHLAPDAGAVLAELRQQLDGQRRRTITRSLTILSAAAAVAVIAITVTLTHHRTNPNNASTNTTPPADQTSAPTAAVMSPTAKLRLIRVARQAAVDAHGEASFVGAVPTTVEVAAQYFADSHDIRFGLPASTPVWILQVRGTFDRDVRVINILVDDDGPHLLAKSAGRDSSLDLAQLGTVTQLYPPPDGPPAGPSR